MKPALFLVIVVFIFSSCSDFYHLRYKKLKKVPATGYVAPVALKEKNVAALPENQNPASQTDSIPANQFPSDSNRVAENVAVKKSPKIPAGLAENNFEKYIPQKIKNVFAKKKQPVKFPVTKQKHDGVGLIIVLFVLIGLGLILLGAWIFAMGIFNGMWWLTVLGSLVILLGLFPILGLVAFCFGDRTPPEKFQYEEK